MAVCKRCGCAIPLGSKICDVCGPIPASAPQAQAWQAPAIDAGPPIQFASTSAAWTAAPRPVTVDGAPKAGFCMRSIAYFIDGIIIALPSIALGSVVLHADAAERSGISLLLELTYFMYFWSGYGKGQTIGMQLLHMRVVKTDGSFLSLTGAFVRYIGLVLAWLVFGIGVIWVAFDANKQGWHDKIAGTYVVSSW